MLVFYWFIFEGWDSDRRSGKYQRRVKNQQWGTKFIQILLGGGGGIYFPRPEALYRILY